MHLDWTKYVFLEHAAPKYNKYYKLNDPFKLLVIKNVVMRISYVIPISGRHRHISIFKNPKPQHWESTYDSLPLLKKA